MNSFTADSAGNLWVTYMIAGAAAPEFDIGIYSSTDGRQPQQLLQSVPADSADLGPGRYTVPLGLTLADLGSSGYDYLAKLDPDDAVEETSKADNISALSIPKAASYQDSSGGVYVVTPSGGQTDSVTASEDPTTGDVTIDANGAYATFSGASAIDVTLQGSGGSVNAAGVDVPATISGGAGSDTIVGGSGSNTIYAGSGSDAIAGGPGDNEIYGGAGFDTLDGSAGQNNWIQAGSGGGLITGGSGNDWLYAGSGGTTTIDGGNGTEVIRGGGGTNYLYGGTGLDDIYGGTGTNYIYGHGIHDILEGGSGENYILPGGGLASIEVKNNVNQPTFDGTIDAEGNSYTGDYRAVDPGFQDGCSSSGSGGNDWTFDDLGSGVRLGEDGTTPLAVYATWQPDGTDFYDPTDGYTGNHWAKDAVYNVYDNGVLLPNGSVTVDQEQSPGNHSPESGDRPWKLLGVWNVPANDTITVELVSGSISGYINNSDQGGMLCAGDAMIHAIWPTISIRPTDGTVNRKVAAANDGDYVDWVDACQGSDIPVEGGDDRVELQLQGSIEQLYTQIQGASLSDWQYVLPAVPGLNFWNDSSGGTQLTAVDTAGDPVNDPSPSSGQYSRTVYASVDPNASLGADATEDAASNSPASDSDSVVQAAPVTIYLNTQNMPANFNIAQVQSEMNTILSAAGVHSKVTICATEQRPNPSNLGFRLDTVHYFGNAGGWGYVPVNVLWYGTATVHDTWTWFTRQVVNYGHYVTFNTAKAPAMAATFHRYDSVLYSTNLADQIKWNSGSPVIAYANILIHEVYWFGVIGHWWDYQSTDGEFQSANSGVKLPVSITAAEAASIDDYLTNGPYNNSAPDKDDPR